MQGKALPLLDLEATLFLPVAFWCTSPILCVLQPGQRHRHAQLMSGSC